MSKVADAFYRTVHTAPGGCESLAPRMGMSSAILRNKADPGKSSNKPMLDDADIVMGLTGDYQILDALAASHGRVCIQVPTDDSPSDMSVLEMIVALWMSNGGFGNEVHLALADHRIEKSELIKVEAAAYAAVQHIHEIVQRLKGMAEK